MVSYDLQGNVYVGYQNESYLIGDVDDKNQFQGVVRYFDSDSKLKGIINVENVPLTDDIEKSDFLWKRMIKNHEQNLIFRSTEKKRIFLFTENFNGSIYNCGIKSSSFFESPYFSDCFEISSNIMMNSTDCSPFINDSISTENWRNSISPTKVNILNHEVYRKGDPLYPSCRPNKYFNEESIRGSVETWWTEMSSRNQDPFWFHEDGSTPFDNPSFPHLKLNLPYFSGRKAFYNAAYTIFSFEKLLHTGFMRNGFINANITVGDVSDWIGPLTVVVTRTSSDSRVERHKKKLEVKLKNDIEFHVHCRIHRSQLSGIVRIMGTLPNDPNDDCEESITKNLGFIGHYKNGVPYGYCWKGLFGGPWIYGMVDTSGHFTGEHISFINQDVSTAFKGSFEKGIMIDARPVEVVGERCNDEGIKILKFSSPNIASNHSYHFERPTAHSYGDQPLLVDPLDDKYIRLGESSINTNEDSQVYKANGAFAKIDIPSGTVIAHNNGLIRSPKEDEEFRNHRSILMKNKSTSLQSQNKTEEEILKIVNDDWGKSSKYRTVLPCRYALDISYDAGQNTEIFRSTKGHKINHSFSRMNSQLFLYDSARFGIVSAMITRKGMIIPQGEEIFTHYGYKYSEVNWARWYQDDFKTFVAENERGFDYECTGNHSNSKLSGFARKCIDYQYKLLNKTLLTTKIQSIKNATHEKFDRILMNHMSLSLLPVKME